MWMLITPSNVNSSLSVDRFAHSPGTICIISVVYTQHMRFTCSQLSESQTLVFQAASFDRNVAISISHLELE